MGKAVGKGAKKQLQRGAFLQRVRPKRKHQVKLQPPKRRVLQRKRERPKS